MGAADDLFEKMQRTKSGWTADDLDALFLGFGFTKREGGKHAIYVHKRDPLTLRAVVTRARSLPVGYVQKAVALVRRLKSLEGAL